MVKKKHPEKPRVLDQPISAGVVIASSVLLPAVSSLPASMASRVVWPGAAQV
jgi:hypothetical protein